MKDYTTIKAKVNISKGRSDEFYDKVQELSGFNMASKLMHDYYSGEEE